jgi:hypothetical protein
MYAVAECTNSTYAIRAFRSITKLPKTPLSNKLCLLKTFSASKEANPNHFRYFAVCTNNPDSRPNAQIPLLVSLVALQIPHPAPPGPYIGTGSNTRKERRMACIAIHSTPLITISAFGRLFHSPVKAASRLLRSSKVDSRRTGNIFTLRLSRFPGLILRLPEPLFAFCCIS